LVAVADLDRSIAFYRKVGPFDEIVCQNGVAVLGGMSPTSIALILRETPGYGRSRRGQQSLGLRSIHFNVGSLHELDRIESVLRGCKKFTSRRPIAGGAADLLFGRDPDNLPLVFVYYANDRPLTPEYCVAVANSVYSLDV
jgi:hypothetical protein